MIRPTISIIFLSILLSMQLYPAFSMSDEEVALKMAGRWKSVEEYTEDGFNYTYIEILRFSKSGKYSGTSETLKNGVSVEYEKFKGFFSIKGDRITWEPAGEESWSDYVKVLFHTLTFTDDEGESMSYIKISRR